MNDIFKIRRAMLVEEAKSIEKLQSSGERGDDFLMRSMVNSSEFANGNFPIAFVDYCIKKIDDALEATLDDYKRSNCILNSNVVEFWQKLDRMNKYRQPEVGDVVVMSHRKHDRLLTSGQFGIIVKVNRDLSFETIEGNVISQFEDEAVTSQYEGVRSRIRNIRGSNKLRVLGYFSPWTDRK